MVDDIDDTWVHTGVCAFVVQLAAKVHLGACVTQTQTDVAVGVSVSLLLWQTQPRLYFHGSLVKIIMMHGHAEGGGWGAIYT